MSCLHFACAQNHQKVVEFLCERGVEHTRDAEGRKPSNLATDNQVMTTCIRTEFFPFNETLTRKYQDMIRSFMLDIFGDHSRIWSSFHKTREAKVVMATPIEAR